MITKAKKHIKHSTKENKLELLFKKGVVSRYEYRNTIHNEVGNIEHFLQYLIDHKIVSPITIRRYTILQAFEELYPQYNFHKSNTVKILAKEFGISERQIWTILKDHSSRFR